MLDINDLKIGINVEYNDQPYIVIFSRHVKIGRGGAVLQTKLKNLITGNVISKNFKGSDKFPEADIAKSKAQFLYQERENFYFMDEANYEQFALSLKQIGSQAQFLKEGTKVEVLNFNHQPINISLPTKVILEVKDAPPGTRGDTARKSGTKQVVLETGSVITAPLFIKKGDKIKINTETGEYAERA